MKSSTVTYREIIRLSLPIIASSAVENITAIINTAFLGHVGAIALGASAVGGIFYLALIMLAFGFGIGVQIIVARRYGEKKIPEIGQIIQQSFIFLIGWGILFTVIFHFWGIQLFRHFVNSEEIFNEVKAYLSYRIWGLSLAYVNIIFRAFYTGIMRTRVVGYYSGILAITNIFFDYVLIFGKLGFPRMEISGAGLSSVIAEAVATVFFIFYTLGRKNIQDFELTRSHAFDWRVMTRTLKIASPVMLQFSFSFGGWFLFFMFVEKMGEIPLAVSNLVRTFYLIALLPLWGYASATNTLVSYLMGSGRTHEIGLTVRKILMLSAGTISSLVIVLTLFSRFYFHLFTNDVLLISQSLPIVYIVGATSVLVSVSIILYNIISGAGKTHITLTIEGIVMFIYVLWAYAVAYWWHGTVTMIWLSELWYGIFMGLIAGAYLKFANWKKAVV
ncbi:MAG: MATE family efflux transporter [Bacteroidales bacterium]|nr:MATE family efflux transporter [Bacteroidales bacterium]